MSKVRKYFFTRLGLFVSDFVFSFVGIFLPRKTRIIFNSSHNNKFSFNSKYLFLYYLRNYSEIDVKFVVNDRPLREKLQKEYGNFFIDNKKIRNKLCILSSKVWVTSTMETPLLGGLHNINRFVIHLSHGAVFKKAGVAENKVSFLKRFYYLLCRSNFSAYVAPSKSLIDATRRVYGESGRKKIIVEGFPRNDLMEPLDRTSRKVLYAPTWRKDGENRILPCEKGQEVELDKLLGEMGVTLYVRQHPLYENNNCFNDFGNIFSFGSEVCGDINDKLHEFCSLITDYSSIFIDSLFLEQAIAFYPHDYDSYNERVGFLFSYFENIPGPQIASLRDLESFLLLSISGEYLEQKCYKEAQEFFFDNLDRESSKRLSGLINSHLFN